MAEQTRPLSKESAPDPARSYERARPEAEAGMGRLDAPKAAPSEKPDRTEHAVGNKQPNRQVNADDVVNAAGGPVPDQREGGKKGQGQGGAQQAGAAEASRGKLPPQPDHSMNEEEPLGWDQAPMEAKDARVKRHSRKEGKGGTP